MATTLRDYAPVENTDAPANELPTLPTLLLGIGGALLLGLLAWAIAMTVLYADATNQHHGGGNTVRNNICNHVPGKAVIDESDGCIYSSQAVVDANAAALQFTSDWNTCLYWLVVEDWAAFTGGNSWSTWGTTAATNPLIAAYDALNATLQAAIDKSTTTFTERATLRSKQATLALLPELAKLHHYHTGTFDFQWQWSSYAPPTCTYVNAFYLPFFAGEPDYTSKAMTFMNNTLNAVLTMNDYYTEALAAGILWFNDSSTLTWYNDWIIATIPGTTQPICDAMPAPADQAACSLLVPQIDAAYATLADIMENQWIPACDAGFNYASGGRSHLPNGVEAGYVWTNFFYSAASADEQRGAVSQIDTANAIEAQQLLDVLFPGTTLPQWIARLNDLNDADVWLCSPDLAPIAERTQEMWDNTTVWSQQAFGYGSFDVATPAFSPSITATGIYTVGNWDTTSLLWRSPSKITYGLATNGPELCFPQYSYQLVSHEGMFGHARQVPLTTFSTCLGDESGGIMTGGFSYLEGIANYGDSFVIYDTDMLAECPRCTLSAQTSYNTSAGSMFDFAFYNNLTFSQCIANSLASGRFPTQSLAYRNCYRSMNSMQRTCYVAPSVHINELREEAEAALGGDFDLLHWHKFIHRVGGLRWEAIDHLNNVYIQWRLGNEAAADMEGYDYIVCQLFGNTWISNMGASHLPILDDRANSNPSKVKAATVAAATSNAQVAAVVQRAATIMRSGISPQ